MSRNETHDSQPARGGGSGRFWLRPFHLGIMSGLFVLTVVFVVGLLLLEPEQTDGKLQPNAGPASSTANPSAGMATAGPGGGEPAPGEPANGARALVGWQAGSLTPEGARARLGKGTIERIAYTADGEFLVASGPLGLYFYDPSTQSLEAYYPAPDTSVSDSRYHDLDIEGPNFLGVLWWGHWIQIADLGAMEVASSKVMPEEVTGLALDPQGGRYALRFQEGWVAIHRLSPEQEWLGELWADSVMGQGGEWECWNPPQSFAFSPDGDLLLDGRTCQRYGSYDSNREITYVWDVQAGTVRYQVQGAEIALWAPDGSLLVTSEGGGLSLWDAASGDWLGELPRPEMVVNITPYAAAFAPDGKTLYVSFEEALAAWDMGSKQVTHAMETARVASEIAVSPDGTQLALLTWDGQIKLLDAALSGEQAAITGHIRQVSPEPSQVRIINGTVISVHSTVVRAWDVESAQPLFESRPSGQAWQWIREMVVSENGNPLAYLTSDGMVRVLEIPSGEERGRVGGYIPLEPGSDAMLDKTVGAIALSADGRLLAGASQNEPFITLWDTTTLTQVRVLNAGLGPDSGQPWMPGARPRHVWDVDFSPEGKLLAAAVDADTETQLMLWDVASGGLRQTIPIGDGYASLAFAPDGASLLIWRNAEGGLGVWDVGSGSLRFALDLEVSYDTQVAFSADGRLLALVSGNLARLVDMASGEELATFRGGAAEGLGAQLKAVALSPDGRWLAAGTEGGELLLWEVEAGEERLRLVGHRGGVESLAFSDDGGTLASSAYDGTVLLWDLDALLP